MVKNLKLLSFMLLFGILILAGCENITNPEKVSCDGEEVCPVQDTTAENNGIVIEETPSVIVNSSEEDLDGGEELFEQDKGNLEGDSIVLESDELSDTDKPLMKIMIDENASSEEIEITASQTCEALGGTWNEGDCTLADGSKVYF